MAEDISTALLPEKIDAWRRNLEKLDPEIANAIKSRLGAASPPPRNLEATTFEIESTPMPDTQVVLETMVRPGRPVLPIKGDAVVREPAYIEEPDGAIMVQRILNAAPKLNPIIPLVGRIDVKNFPRGLSYIGTGWLIEPDVVVTNSHVAELIGRRDGNSYTFLPGQFGDPIVSSVNWKHEMDQPAGPASPIERILFIESRQKADIAFLKIKRRTDGTRQDRILLADANATPGTSVAVIGYPARAYEDIIPDQAWMERVFGGRYDVKRAAPGVMTDDSRGWATHDCTTLGGNSGSAVIDLATGKAVALHFAGKYVIENYAVPASIIRNYLTRRPYNVETGAVAAENNSEALVVQAPAAAGTQVSVTFPVTVTVSVGNSIAASGSAITAGPGEVASIEEAARQFWSSYSGGGILNVRSGLAIRNGEFSDTPCIRVGAHPEMISSVRARCPSTFKGHPVEVRAASVFETTGGDNFTVEAAVTSIAYDDDARTGSKFSFDEVEDEMEVLCCVGPERSWSVLSNYIAKAKGRMVSSIYEFHAKHVADAIQKRLEDGVKMALVMDNATRVTKVGVKAGDFNRKTVFPRWADEYDFDRIYAPEGVNGLIANSYHIKVTVDDNDQFWLSSGNWKNSSQPNIATADLNNLAKIKAAKGNREWHVVIKNKKLAGFFRNHILQDLKFSKENEGKEEAFAEDVFVDIPLTLEQSVELEARAASRIIEPLKINRSVKVKPLLTPDIKGKIYSEAVLELIESAEEQLLFQIPYINSENASGYLEKLVKALIRKSKEIEDTRIILRSDHGSWIPCAEDLKKRGLNLRKNLKHLPKTHTKGMIVDGKRVLIGSHNWSGGGVTLNRDASLLFDDANIAKYYRDVFLMDWDRASDPVIPESAVNEAPRIANPLSPVPAGYRRVTIEEFMEG